MQNDISKCEGKDCDLAENCWRYQVEASQAQTWAAFDAEPKPCKAYWPIYRDVA